MPRFRLLYSRQYFPYIPLALSLAVMSLYFVRYIHSSATLMVSHYIHASAALIFRTLYPWLYEVFATIECGFTVKRVRDMIRTYSQKTD